MKTGKTELNLNEMTNAAGGELHPMLMNDGEKNPLLEAVRDWARYVYRTFIIRRETLS